MRACRSPGPPWHLSALAELGACRCVTTSMHGCPAGLPGGCGQPVTGRRGLQASSSWRRTWQRSAAGASRWCGWTPLATPQRRCAALRCWVRADQAEFKTAQHGLVVSMQCAACSAGCTAHVPPMAVSPAAPGAQRGWSGAGLTRLAAVHAERAGCAAAGHTLLHGGARVLGAAGDAAQHRRRHRPGVGPLARLVCPFQAPAAGPVRHACACAGCPGAHQGMLHVLTVTPAAARAPAAAACTQHQPWNRGCPEPA